MASVLIDERKKVARLSKIMTGRPGNGMPHDTMDPVRPMQPMKGAQGQFHPVSFNDAEPNRAEAYFQAGRESEPKKKKGGIGRRNKPVIPFGVDRTRQARAAENAAEMVDVSADLSMNLNEPEVLRRHEANMRQMQQAQMHRMPMQQMPPRAAMQPDDARMRDPSRMHNDPRMHQNHMEQRAPQRNPMNEQTQMNGQQAYQPIRGVDDRTQRQRQRDDMRSQRNVAGSARRDSSERRRRSQRAQSAMESGGIQIPEERRSKDSISKQITGRIDLGENANPHERRPSVAPSERRGQKQENAVNRSTQKAVSDTRADFENLNRTMREKEAVSAVWMAEEERRVAEKQARTEQVRTESQIRTIE